MGTKRQKTMTRTKKNKEARPGTKRRKGGMRARTASTVFRQRQKLVEAHSKK